MDHNDRAHGRNVVRSGVEHLAGNILILQDVHHATLVLLMCSHSFMLFWRLLQ